MKVLITGASRGIGRACAELFAKEGYELVLLCKNNLEMLRDLSKELIGKYGAAVQYMKCDISSCEEVTALFEKIGEVDIVIHNAAISYVGLLTDMSEKEWDETISTNLSSCFYLCKNAVPSMVRKKEGKIILVSSVWGNCGASMEVAYSTAKGGVNSFAKALAKELGPSNIQVNAVAFGIMDTDMNAHLNEEETAAIEEEIPVGRMGNPMEGAEMILQVVKSPAYLTGQVITMDGGWQ